LRVDGADRLISKLGAMPGRVEGEVKRTLPRIGADLQGKSQRVAPMRESDLRAHAFFRLIPGLGVEVGYEGLPYIIPQHEGGWLNHMGKNGPVDIENYTTPGTGDKFLERPFMENKPRYKDAVKDAARKGVRG